MNTRVGSELLRKLLPLFAALLCVTAATAAETNGAAADVEGRTAEAVVIGTQESLRSSLQIQEELHNTQAAIEKNRQEAEAAAARNAEILEARLNLIEKSIASQRLDELKDLQRSNRMILFAAGAFAVVGFVVLLFAAFVQWTAVGRLTSLSTRMPNGLPAGQTLAALGMGEGSLLPAQGVEQSTARFLGVVEKLEKRLNTIEKAATTANSEHPAVNGSANGDTGTVGDETNGESAAESGGKAPESIALLMGKGQTLLKLDKPDEAIVCFDQALAIDPDNTDILVRKGAALERLQKMDEAIACYDQAIAADSSMTMAYLYKGGVYNRMERYSEALECYEQALKTQQKGQAANVIIEN